MAAPPIPTWKERLFACFRFRHRLLHVFGVPAAIGAVTSVAAASALNPDTGLALGMLVAGLGSLIGGYYVTAGFDRGLVERLQAEKLETGARLDEQHLKSIVFNSPPEIRPLLERIVGTHAAIEAVFVNGPNDAVERVLQGSREDLRALRDRAVKLVDVFRGLTEVIQQSDGQRLHNELNHLQKALKHMPPGPARQAQEQACASAERTYSQWHAACEKRSQVGSVLTVIEKNLEEFRLAMALRKVDELEGQDSSTNVSELQARLSAAGEACDQLVGRTSTAPRRARRARA